MNDLERSAGERYEKAIALAALELAASSKPTADLYNREMGILTKKYDRAMARARRRYMLDMEAAKK